MALTVEIDKSGFQDISDYIVSIGDVPYIRRNRDWTPVAEDVSISISYASPYDILKGDVIKIKNGATILFYGSVQSVVKSTDTRLFKCKVDPELLGLKDYLVEYDEIHDEIAETGDKFLYQAASLSGVPTVQVLWLMQKLFEKKGLTLDVSNVEDVVAFNYTFVTSETLDVEYKRITLDENMIYCLNQNVAVFHTTIDGLYDYNGHKITAWALIQQICSALRFSLTISGANNYQLDLETANYSIAPIDTYSQGLEDIEAISPDVSVSYFGLERRFYLNNDVDTIELKQFDGYGSENNIRLEDNLEFYFHFRFEGAWFPGGEVPLEISVGGGSTLNPAKAMVDKILNTYTKEKVVTEILTTIKTVVQNKINLEKQTSKIIQEVLN